MELVLQDVQSTITISDKIFACSFNKELVHQVVNAYAAGARQGTRAQKNRAEVTASNKKPWRQKGTGRARSGSVKSPIWRSGGVTFAARPQDYRQKVNKRMYRAALKSIFSELVRQNRLIILEKFSIEMPKTKLLVKKLQDMALKDVLIFTNKVSNNLLLATRNLPKVEVRNTACIDPISLLSFDKVIMTIDAMKRVEEMLE